jgi:hypothetical protein
MRRLFANPALDFSKSRRESIATSPYLQAYRVSTSTISLAAVIRLRLLLLAGLFPAPREIVQPLPLCWSKAAVVQMLVGRAQDEAVGLLPALVFAGERIEPRRQRSSILASAIEGGVGIAGAINGE